MKYSCFEDKLLFVLEQDSYNINRCATISCYSDTKIATYSVSDGISHWSLVSTALHCTVVFHVIPRTYEYS